MNTIVNINSVPIKSQTNTPSTITKASITQSNNGAKQLASYTITIYPNSDISTTGGIEVIYPSQVNIPNSLTGTVTSDSTKRTPTLTLDKS